ncbi:MAG: phage portal protein [Pseudomonadota bacterium]
MIDPKKEGRGMRRFAPFLERKSDSPQQMSQQFLAFAGITKPSWTVPTYAALAAEGYERNPVVYRSVRMIAEAASTVQIVETAPREGEPKHPILDLIEMPNAEETKSEFIDSLVSHLLVAGNAYIERQFSDDGSPLTLNLLRPDRMTVEAGGDGWPIAYRYHAGNHVRVFNDPSDILHLKMFAPRDDHYGLSPLAAAAQSLDIHNAAGAWNKALLDNAARPSGALVYSAEQGNLSDDQFKRLKEELEANFQGATNAGRPLLLEGGLDWKALSMSPKDLDFVETKDRAAREIALAFGVPPMLLGLPGDNTYANYREANRAFWRQTVLPLVNRVTTGIAQWLGPIYPTLPHIGPDLNSIEALTPERDALWARVMSSDVLTPNEKRAAVGFGPIDGGDVPPFAPATARSGGAHE